MLVTILILYKLLTFFIQRLQTFLKFCHVFNVFKRFFFNFNMNVFLHL